SAGPDHHHAQEHDRGQGQAESPLQVSHSDLPPLEFFGHERGRVLGKELCFSTELVDRSV
ncbi:hypothetical protein, partial [uncultured Oscillibacter sp.]|uniref:hypothetical protein n=1 Tax=uncultured Oscillibacter sp. TaxID=876091 RepID=UPI00262B9824